MSLPDSPSAHIRRAQSTPRRRTTDPQPRRREHDHKSGKSGLGALVTIVFGVLFLGYVFNVANFATASNSFFSGLDVSAKSHTGTVVLLVGLVLPVLELLVVALAIFGVVRFLMSGMQRSNKKRKLAGRDVVSLEQFKALTTERGIRPRIAGEAYGLLLPFYRKSMRARLDDRLLEDLHVKAHQVSDIYADLLLRTDRKATVGEPVEIKTVLDLLLAVQNAKRNSLMDSMARPVMRLRQSSMHRKAATAEIKRSKARATSAR